MFDEDARSKYSLYLGFFLTLFGYAGRYAGIEPIYNQFFPFAAWSYIILVDNLVWRFKGNSPLISRTEEFFFLAAWSLALCGLAELLNLRLGAWHYTNMCADLTARWTGRVFSWAALLPSLFVTAEMLSIIAPLRRARSRPFRIEPSLTVKLAAGGALALALALALPGPFWPLAIPAFFLLAESLNLKLGLPSLLRELAGGLPDKTLRLAFAGLACGLIWNWWNKGAGAVWEHLPGFLSAAPWAAYAGFPAVGLTAYSLYSLASWLRCARSWEEIPWKLPGTPPRASFRVSAALILIITSYIALRAVDTCTVRLYLGWI